jgi:hypothetical protein
MVKMHGRRKQFSYHFLQLINSTKFFLMDSLAKQVITEFIKTKELFFKSK